MHPNDSLASYPTSLKAWPWRESQLLVWNKFQYRPNPVSWYCLITTGYPNRLAYLVINHLLWLAVLPQHGEELNDVGVLWKHKLGDYLKQGSIHTSLLNWSPVPSKQSTIVRWECVGGMIVSRWCLSSALDRSDSGERPSGVSSSSSTLLRWGIALPFKLCDSSFSMAMGKTTSLTAGHLGRPDPYMLRVHQQKFPKLSGAEAHGRVCESCDTYPIINGK